MNKLIEWRKKNKYDGGEAAEIFGISRSFLSLLEHKKRTPNLKLALKIEKRTGGFVSVNSWE